MNDNMIQDSALVVEEPDNSFAPEEDLKFRRPKRLFKKKKTLIIFIVIISLLVLSAAAATAVMLLKPDKVYDDSAAFYFSSDLLSEEGGEFVVYETIDFSIYNYADALRVSKEPIEDFSITVKADGKDITSKVDITTGEKAMTPDIRNACDVCISVPEKYADSIIDVFVESSPVPKQLKASFKLEPAWGYSVSDEKGNVCAELVIYANKDVALELSWDEDKLIPDSTDSYIRAAEYGENKCTIELVSGTSASIPLFKVNPSKDISKDSKALTLEAVGTVVTTEKNEETEDITEAVEDTEPEENEVVSE